jgi:hypothetical protein
MAWRAVPEAPKHFQDRFRAKVRILVDESLGEGVARFLRDRGCNVVYAREAGLAGMGDEAVAAYAWREKRMIWTHDRDFLNDALVPEHRNPGVVVLPGGGDEEGLRTALTVFDRGGQLWAKSKSVVGANGEMTIRSRNPNGKMSTSRYRLTKDGAEEWHDT